MTLHGSHQPAQNSSSIGRFADTAASRAVSIRVCQGMEGVSPTLPLGAFDWCGSASFDQLAATPPAVTSAARPVAASVHPQLRFMGNLRTESGPRVAPG